MRFLAPLLANLFLILSAFGFGGILLPILPQELSRIDRLAILPLAGLGMQGLLLFLLGLVRFTPISMLFVLIPGAILGFWSLRREFAPPRGIFELKMPLAIPFTVVGIVLVITILGGFSEPYGDLRSTDSVAYHYLGPKVWLRNGVIRPVLDESQTAFPATVEIQYAPLMAYGSPSGPEFFSVLVFALMLLSIAGLAARCGLDLGNVWWLMAVVSTMPAVYRGLYGGMIDVIYSCFLLAAARIAFDAKLRGEFVVAGLFCGFAMGSKYTGLMAAPLLCACVLLFPPDSTKRFSRSLLTPLVFAGAAAVVVAAPWYIRNWVELGCPIYPPPMILEKMLPARYFPPQALQGYTDLMLRVGRAMGKDPLHLLLLPFNLTFHTANFEGGAGGIGLVPLAFAPFCFRAGAWNRFAKGLALFGILTTLAWFCTMQESRYLILGYLIVAIFATAGWGSVARNASRFARMLAALTVAISILYGLFMILTARADDIHSGVSASFAERRRHAEIPFVESFRYLNEDPGVGKVLILDPLVPSFYLDKNYIKPLGRRGEEPIPGIHSPHELLSDLKKWKITNVLDVQWKEGNFQVPENQKDLKLVFEENGQRIYRILPTD